MVAPPPGRFSMTMDWLRRVPSAWVMNRAMVSIGPPAGNGTISLIGFSGYPCAATFGATPRTPAAIAAPKMSRLAIMRSSALRGFAASIHLDDCYVLALHIADVWPWRRCVLRGPGLADQFNGASRCARR